MILRNKTKFLSFILFTFLLTSCGSTPTPTPTKDEYKVNIVTEGTLKPSITDYKFEKDNFTPFTVTYDGDDLYGISESSVKCEPATAAKLVVDEANRAITVTPLENTNFDVVVTPYTIQYNVTFHAEGLTILGHEDEDEVTIQCNRKSRFGSYKLAVAESPHFLFRGWSYDKTLVGSKINDNDVLLNDIDVYPSYDLGVTLKVDTTESSLIDLYSIDQTIFFTNCLKLFIGIKDEKHFSLYDSSTKNIRITSDDEDITNNVTVDDTTKSISIPYEFIKGNIVITIKPYQPFYNVTCNLLGEVKNLVFIGKPKVAKGYDYNFVLRVQEGVASVTVPTALEIVVGGKAVLSKAYTYEIYDEGKTGYYVINSKYITGDVQITTNSIIENNYLYQIYNYGTVEYEAENTNNDPLPTTGIKSTSDDFKFKISKSENGETPVESQNIYVSIDGGDWTNPKEESEGLKRFSFDDKNQIFTIPKDESGQNKIEYYVEIYIRHPEYPILNDLTWSDVSYLSSTGLASKLLYLGDEKEVNNPKIETKNKYTARVIGFNHDTLADKSGKAGITFEFTNVISDKNGNAVKKHFDHDRGLTHEEHFYKQEYHNYLNGTFKEQFEDDFLSEVKEVTKTAYEVRLKGVREPYNTTFFPLSACEMDNNFTDLQEGDLYEYYVKQCYDHFRVKKDLNGVAQTYWTRTTYVNWSGSSIELRAYVFDDIGSRQYKTHNKNHSYMAAFCI